MRRYLLILVALFAPVLCHAQEDEAFRAYLIQWEGYTHQPVTHPNGEITVGIGHNCRYHVPFPLKSYYSDEYLRRLYDRDFADALWAARSGVWGFDTLPRKIQYTVLSIIWTVGPTGFMRFKDFRAALSERMYEVAAYALLNTEWAHQVGHARYMDHYETIKEGEGS